MFLTVAAAGAARFRTFSISNLDVFKLSTSDHVTASLLELHWLPVQWRIKFKLCCIMDSVFYGRCPAYLTATVQSLNASRPHLGQRLRPTSTTDFSLPQLRTKFGERAFSHAGPAAWNSLPEHIRAEPSPVVLLQTSGFQKIMRLAGTLG